MLKDKKISSIEELKDFLISYCKDKDAKIYLFGSRAKGNSSITSDIDIAIEGENIDFSYLREIIEESNLPQKVDLVNMKNISKDFKEEIIKTGIRWL